MILNLVPHTHLDSIWSEVAPLLESALSTECTIDQLRMLIVRQESYLIAVVDSDRIVGAITLEFVNYPNKRVALGGAFGGKGICTQEVFDQLKEWCRHMGASEFRTFCGESQARLYAKVGMGKLYNVVGVQL